MRRVTSGFSSGFRYSWGIWPTISPNSRAMVRSTVGSIAKTTEGGRLMLRLDRPEDEKPVAGFDDTVRVAFGMTVLRSRSALGFSTVSIRADAVEEGSGALRKS